MKTREPPRPPKPPAQIIHIDVARRRRKPPGPHPIADAIALRFDGPPKTTTCLIALRQTFAMAQELTGCYPPGAAEEWRRWLSRCEAAIISGIPVTTLERKIQ